MKEYLAALCLTLGPLASANAAPEVAASADARDAFDAPANMVFVHPDWTTLRGAGVTWITQLSPQWALHLEGNLGGRRRDLKQPMDGPDGPVISVGSEERALETQVLAGVDLLPFGVSNGGPLLGARIGGRMDRLAFTSHVIDSSIVQTTWTAKLGARAGYLARFGFGLALQAAVGFDAGYSRTHGGWNDSMFAEESTSLSPAIELGVGWAF